MEMKMSEVFSPPSTLATVCEFTMAFQEECI